MKLSIRSSLLIAMLSIGLVFGIVYHYLVMPLLGSELIHCISSGLIFGLINYFISIGIYKRFEELKKVNKTLQKNMYVDKLTNLLNRRSFDNAMMKLSNNEIYSLIFIDIDNFRRFNNQFGHKIGDIVLQKVSHTIKNNIRTIDSAYRYGGEEIVILLKDCDKANALKIAEKIRISISKIDNSPFPSITVSLGISSCPEDGTDISKIIVACDSALLIAKRSGKNRTIICNELQKNVSSGAVN